MKIIKKNISYLLTYSFSNTYNFSVEEEKKIKNKENTCEIILKLKDKEYQNFISSSNKEKLNYIFSKTFLTRSHTDDIYKLKINNLSILHDDIYKCVIKNKKKLFLYDLSLMFSGKSNIISIKGLEDIIDIFRVSDISFIFADCYSLIYVNDLSKWSIAKFKFVDYVFYNCYSLLKVDGIENWNLKKIKCANHMFGGCHSLVSLPDISKWNVSNLNEMHCMFYNCTSLISLPNISKWKLKDINDTTQMFSGCTSLVSLPNLSKWEANDVCLNLYFSENAISLLNNKNTIKNSKDTSCIIF